MWDFSIHTDLDGSPANAKSKKQAAKQYEWYTLVCGGDEIKNTSIRVFSNLVKTSSGRDTAAGSSAYFQGGQTRGWESEGRDRCGFYSMHFYTSNGHYFKGLLFIKNEDRSVKSVNCFHSTPFPLPNIPIFVAFPPARPRERVSKRIYGFIWNQNDSSESRMASDTWSDGSGLLVSHHKCPHSIMILGSVDPKHLPLPLQTAFPHLAEAFISDWISSLQNDWPKTLSKDWGPENSVPFLKSPCNAYF